MNVKKYIHPRNKYKKPPNYKQLAIKYPDFREIAITDLTGKIKIDFQNKNSLRVLTETLLKHDFDLHVSIPPDNLNPAITLRMNYILWIEDLINHSKLEMNKIIGIDIGTGAICIYALLLAKIYGCHIIGTEIDKKSAEYAKQCIRRNNLQDLIKINSGRLFKDIMEDDKTYDFSMCNPPFFKSEDNNEKIAKVLPPRNAATGNDSELMIKGGEIAFVTKMIDESIQLGDRIKIYSTMIGRKADLFNLKRLIRSKDIENVTWTEFCQGHTTRWGLAWSFLPKNIIDLDTAPVIRKTGKSMVQDFKKDYKILIEFPVDDKFSCMNDLISFLKTTAQELNVKLEDIPITKDNFDIWLCRITAVEKSWEHMRKRRRLAQQQVMLKNIKEDNEYVEVNVDNKNLSNEQVIEIKNDSKNPNKNSSSGCIPLLTCKFWVEIKSLECEETISRNNVFRIWIIFENGSGGLDALQSLRQYLINKLEVRKKILKSPSKPVKQNRKRKKKNSSNSGNFEEITIE